MLLVRMLKGLLGKAAPKLLRGNAAEPARSMRDQSVSPGQPDGHPVGDTAAAIQLMISGHECYARRELGPAIAQYDHALDLDPELSQARHARAAALLAAGDYARGWREYEVRWEKVRIVARKNIFLQPRWHGTEAIAGRTLLVHAEQGLGDAIQFVRYLSLLAPRGATLILQCHAELVALFSRLPGVAAVVPKHAALPHFDFQIPMLSLPLALRTTLETIPAAVPYLFAHPEQVARLRTQPARDSGKLRVGVVWASTSDAEDARKKSCGLGQMSRLFDIPGAVFFSLQKGEAGRIPGPLREVLVDAAADLADFESTAALVSTLDLVIAIDTAVAHLAGALGKPTWILLTYLPDWRWMIEGERSAWYPTARLFRQPEAGDWNAVLTDVRNALAALCESRHAANDARAY